jgi:phosphatidylinositol-3-phosphatase
MRPSKPIFFTFATSLFLALAGCGGTSDTATGSGAGGSTPGAGGSNNAGGSNFGGTNNAGGSNFGGTNNVGGGSNAGGASNTGGGGVGGGGVGGAAASTSASSSSTGAGGGGQAIQTVFLIMMENHDWSTIHGSGSAPYINNTLFHTAAHAEKYKTPTGNHPSEPNYIWLESGGNLGITTDDDPSSNHQATTDHLTTHLEAAGDTWKAYAEGISGTDCPQADTGLFVVRHTPMLFFDDVTNNGSTTSQHCIQHVRPYSELATDLSANTVARYNFITPNVCHDMHGQTTDGFTCNIFDPSTDLIQLGDTWLSTEIPKIMASAAYQNGGVIFVVWDEGDESGLGSADDGPMPFFAISSKAKPGYAGNVAYTHSSTLRSVQEILGISPFMRDAGNASDLSDLFTSFP